VSATEDRTQQSTPRADGFAMPPEWAPHERTFMAWPARDSLWGATLEQAKQDYAATANAVAAFEPVTMVARPQDAGAARRALAGEVEVLELPIDDSWLRDSGPVFLLDGDGQPGRRACSASTPGASASSPTTTTRRSAGASASTSACRPTAPGWCSRAGRSSSTARAPR
jgi:hypothetical protein